MNLLIVRLLFVTLIYFISKWLFKKKYDAQQNIIWAMFLLFGFYQALYGLYQLYGSESNYYTGFRVRGLFPNPAPYSGYLISVFPMSLAAYHFTDNLSRWKKMLRFSGLITSLSILLVLPATQSRAGWIAMVIGATIIYINYFNTQAFVEFIFRTRIRTIVTAIMVISLVVCLALGLFYFKRESALGRALIWKISFNMVADTPIFGVGYNKYSSTFGKYQSDYFNSNMNTEEAMVAGKGEYAFNEFLLIATENGLIGLLLFLGIIYTSIVNIFPKWNKVKQKKNIVVGALGGLVSLITFSFFSYPFSSAPLLLNFYIFLSILSTFSYQKYIFSIRFRSYVIVKLILFAIAIFLITFLSQNIYEKYLASTKWKEGSNLKDVRDYAKAVEMMKSIEPILNDNGEFMFEYGQILTLNWEYDKGITILEKAAKLTSDPYLFCSLGNCYQKIKKYRHAEKAYIHAFYLVPHKFYPRYLLAKLYAEIGEPNKALAIINQIMKMKMKIPSSAIDDIKTEMRNLKKSQEILKNKSVKE